VAELAVSNIAWTNNEELEVAKKLQQLGVKKVEIAPTKRWEDPTKATPEEIQEYVAWWAQFDIEVVAFQSMLFARPDLKLFEGESLRDEAQRYMTEFLRLAGDMGAKRLVFGSPKNRQRGELPIVEADATAVDFFAKLGEAATTYATMLCIEPNAPQYNCDYITTAAEGAALVRQIGSTGIGLHLDTACMALAGDDLGESIRANADILEHFHVSAPMLDRVYERNDVDYKAAAQALRDINYDKVISIEMRPGEEGQNVARVEEAVRFVQTNFPVN
jgi:D-psicose/D-tagatose/L-ribulose 3-epimerase